MPELLWGNCLNAIADLCVSQRGAAALRIQGADMDSRRLASGFVFCAIAGSRDDGARYVQSALDAGAVAIVAETPLELPEHVPFAQVTDGYVAAGRLAETVYGRPADGLELYGVTGTNGKTTVAFLLRDLLRAGKIDAGMIGTVRYEYGTVAEPADRTTPTPFRLQQLLGRMRDAGTRAVVMETSSHALHQRRMGTAQFRSGIFTNLTGDHLDYHLTMEAYYQAKKILFDSYLSPEGAAVVNVDDAYGARLAAELKTAGRRVIALGHGGDCDARITRTALDVAGSRFVLEWQNTVREYRSPLIGDHNVMNAAQAAVVALDARIDPDVVAATIAASPGAPGRLEAVASPRGFTVYVDYAHTDDALKNVLTALRALSPRSLAVVFGCGGDRDRSKRSRMGQVAGALADRVYVTSDNPRSELPESIIDDIAKGIPAGQAHCRTVDREAAIQRALAESEPGDVVLIAGKGHETYQEIDGVQYPFDDMSVVRQLLATDGETAGGH